MTDEQSPDQPLSDSEGDNTGGFSSENELDQILAEAASLASDLSLEVGEADSSSTNSDNPAPDSGTAGDVSAQLDTELAALENLVANTTAELGDPTDISQTAESQTDIPEATAEGQADRSSDPSDAAELPSEQPEKDTLSQTNDSDSAQKQSPEPTADEDTSSQTETKKQADSGDAAPVIATQKETKKSKTSRITLSPLKPGVVGTGMLGVVKGEGEVGDESDLEGGSRETQKPRPQWVEALDSRVSPFALAACTKGVKILEVIDKPLSGKINDNTRMLLGWAAVATLGTSILVYFISFFYTP